MMIAADVIAVVAVAEDFSKTQCVGSHCLYHLLSSCKPDEWCWLGQKNDGRERVRERKVNGRKRDSG